MDSKKMAAAVAEGAPPALDRATVEALEGAARARANGEWKLSVHTPNRVDTPDGSITVAWYNNRFENPYQLGEETAAFIAAANPSFILQLIADWKILAGQNEMAFNANRDLGASNDELLLRVCRLEKALREIARFDDAAANDRLTKDGSFSSFDEPHSVQIARTALEGSERRG